MPKLRHPQVHQLIWEVYAGTGSTRDTDETALNGLYKTGLHPDSIGKAHNYLFLGVGVLSNCRYPLAMAQ